MKKGILFLAGVLMMTMVLTGCGSKSANTTADSEAYPPFTPDYSDNSGGVAGQPEAVPSFSGNQIYDSESNKIIRTASLTIQTTEFETAVAALTKLTEAQGGYYETARVDSGGYYDKYASRSAYYVVRVPKENFTAFRDGTGGIGHIYSISEDSQDIGETYYDTEARLETLTTKRERLLALLDKADQMEDIISLESALADVQYEIDLHTATLRRYDSLISYSTFTIELSEVIKITEEPGVKESFGSKLLSSLKEGAARFGEGIQSFILWLAQNLIGVVIFMAAAAVVIVLVCRRLRRRQSKKPE